MGAFTHVDVCTSARSQEEVPTWNSDQRSKMSVGAGEKKVEEKMNSR